MPQARGTFTRRSTLALLPVMQTIATFNSSFNDLLQGYRVLHLVCTILTALSALLMLSPAAYHRHAESHLFSKRFVKGSSVVIAMGLCLLGTSISLEFVVISQFVWGANNAGGWAIFGCLFAISALMWFAIPLVARQVVHKEEYMLEELAVRRSEEDEQTRRSLRRIGPGASGGSGYGSDGAEASMTESKAEPQARGPLLPQPPASGAAVASAAPLLVGFGEPEDHGLGVGEFTAPATSGARRRVHTGGSPNGGGMLGNTPMR
jgi:hypothetical protein